ncbi:MAG: sugar ABC transporter substrate-binding protein [Hyphomicrobiales bacterium]|nr:sugar ABC transporter substrate-binding protein [Hyphomicrobiales bacterium]
MHTFSKALIGAAIAVGFLGAQVQAQNNDPARIVFVTHASATSAFWSTVKKGVDDAAALMGADVQYQSPQVFDVVAMAQLIDAAVATNPDGLVVSIPDADALGDPIRAAVAAGIPVISMDSGEEVSKELGALFHMGINEYDSGLQAGERMKAAGLTAGACVNGEVGNVALDLRCEGFEAGLGGDVSVIATTFDPTEIRNGVEAFLGQHPEIDAVLTCCAEAFDPTLEAIRNIADADPDRKIEIGSFDLSPTLLEAIDKGEAMFAIDAQQYLTGYLPVVFLALHHKLGMVPVTNVMTGPLFVMQDTAADVIDMAGKGYR